MKIKINQYTLTAMDCLIDTPLLKHSRFGDVLYAILSYTVVYEPRSKLTHFLNKNCSDNIFITEMSVVVYSDKHNRIGELTDGACERLLRYSDLHELHDNWEKHKTMLKAFKFELVSSNKFIKI